MSFRVYLYVPERSTKTQVSRRFDECASFCMFETAAHLYRSLQLPTQVTCTPQAPVQREEAKEEERKREEPCGRLPTGTSLLNASRFCRFWDFAEFSFPYICFCHVSSSLN